MSEYRLEMCDVGVLGDLDIDFTYNSSLSILNSPLNNYRRWLNLRDAVAYTAFRLEDVDYRREYFVSRDRDVMLIHLVAGREGTLNFSARLSRAEHSLVTVQGNTLLMDGMLESGKPGLDGMKYRVAMQLVQNGGESSVSPENGICTSRFQSNENPILSSWLRYLLMFSAVVMAGCCPVCMAYCSAGSP